MTCPRPSGRDNVFDVDALYNIVYNGQRQMPGFGETCAPRGQCTFGPRLPDEEVRAVAEYVQAQAEASWGK